MPRHGDLATNAAMVLAKDAGKKPRDLAERIAAALRRRPEIEAVEVAGPGFINLPLDPGVWHDALRAAIVAGPAYGQGDLGKADKVNVEYVSANPTGPMHVGHCRGAVFGDALANLLAFAGYAVTREYYINDAGAQVDVLARSAFLRYREALGEDDRRDPGRALSRRLSQARRGGARRRVRPTRSIRCRRTKWLPIVRASGDRHDDGRDPRGSRRAQRRARRVLLRALADRRAARRGRRDDRATCARRATSTRAGCRRRRARRSRTGRTASRPCSAPPSSATTSTGR